MGPPEEGTEGSRRPLVGRCWNDPQSRTDLLQRPIVRAVSKEVNRTGEADHGFEEWGRRGGDVSATPTLPTAWLMDASAADLWRTTGSAFHGAMLRQLSSTAPSWLAC